MTVKFNQPANYPDIRVLEYQGVSTLDAVISNFGNSASASSRSLQTHTATELLVAADTVQTGSSTAGPSFTLRVVTVPDSDLVEDRIVTSTGAYAATAPLTGSGPWVMQMITFH